MLSLWVLHCTADEEVWLPKLLPIFLHFSYFRAILGCILRRWKRVGSVLDFFCGYYGQSSSVLLC